MNRFAKEAVTRALCAAVWCAPGALWWAAPALAAPFTVSLAPESFPPPPGVYLCGNALWTTIRPSEVAFHLARRRPELVDTLIAASESGSSPYRAQQARALLAATGQARALRYLAAYREPLVLPELFVRARAVPTGGDSP